MTRVDTFYGLELFKSGRVLRISEVVLGEEMRCFLGWKEPDIGKFANIRQEYSEEITTGIANSAIMRRLGWKEGIRTHHEIIRELKRLGHCRFMSYQGKDIVGQYEPFGINVKLTICPVLKWPLLVEIEKIAHAEEEATQYEQDLRELLRQFKLQSYLVREEPPSLLYASLFAHECDGN
jgi:adenylate cyclase class IV